MIYALPPIYFYFKTQLDITFAFPLITWNTCGQKYVFHCRPGEVFNTSYRGRRRLDQKQPVFKKSCAIWVALDSSSTWECQRNVKRYLSMGDFNRYLTRIWYSLVELVGEMYCGKFLPNGHSDFCIHLVLEQNFTGKEIINDLTLHKK